MVRDTRVHIINDSDQRIKIKAQFPSDQTKNLDPGEDFVLQGSVSGRGRWDVKFDVIVNPSGPDNNTRLDTWTFDNPVFAYARSEYARAQEAVWYGRRAQDSGERGKLPVETGYWHRATARDKRELDWGLEPPGDNTPDRDLSDRVKDRFFKRVVNEVDNGFAPNGPRYRTEGFPTQDPITWDLHIISVGDL